MKTEINELKELADEMKIEFKPEVLKIIAKKIGDGENKEAELRLWNDAVNFNSHCNFSIIQKSMFEKGFTFNVDPELRLVIKKNDLELIIDYPKNNKDIIEKMKEAMKNKDTEHKYKYIIKDIEELEKVYSENFTRNMSWDVDDIYRIAGYQELKIGEDDAMLVLRHCIDPLVFDTSMSFDDQVTEFLKECKKDGDLYTLEECEATE